MNGLLAFLGAFLAVVIVAVILVSVVTKKLKRLSNRLLRPRNIARVLSQIEVEQEALPRSLSACDSLVIPQVLRDFPDFDPNLVKTYARDYLKKKFGNKPGFTIHNVAYTHYLTSNLQKTVVLQASVCWKENGKTLQKRFDLHYTYLLSSNDTTVAANCPNCGATIGYGEIGCAYCGSRVANVLGNTWEFTDLIES